MSGKEQCHDGGTAPVDIIGSRWWGVPNPAYRDLEKYQVESVGNGRVTLIPASAGVTPKHLSITVDELRENWSLA